MIKEAIATGATVDEAREAAALLLGAGIDDDVKYEIIDMPQKKTLGLFGGCPAKVRAYIELEDEVKADPAGTKPVGAAAPERDRKNDLKPQRSSRPVRAEKAEKSDKKETGKPSASRTQNTSDGEKADIFEKRPITDEEKLKTARRAEEYLTKVLSCMDIEAEISVSDYDGGIEITLEGDNIGTVVGRRGETLDALQYLTVLAANGSETAYQRILLNTGDYRNKRQKALQTLASRIASQALKNGKNIALEPMNPYERRIIHMTVHDIEGITSWSIGSEPYRRVVIGTSKDGHITYNNRRDSGRRDSRGGSYSRGRSYQRRPRNDRPVTASAPDREQKKDMDTAPLYGRIDKKS